MAQLIMVKVSLFMYNFYFWPSTSQTMPTTSFDSDRFVCLYIYIYIYIYFFFFFFLQAYTSLVDEKESNALTFPSLELAHTCGFGQKHLLGQVLAQGFIRRSIRLGHQESLGSGFGSELKGSTLSPLLIYKRKHMGEIE